MPTTRRNAVRGAVLGCARRVTGYVLATQGAQLETYRPQVSEPACNGDHTEEDGPNYRITVGGLECFEEAMRLLIRAGAQNWHDPRVSAVHLPICVNQAEALRALSGERVTSRTERPAHPVAVSALRPQSRSAACGAGTAHQVDGPLRGFHGSVQVVEGEVCRGLPGLFPPVSRVIPRWWCRLAARVEASAARAWRRPRGCRSRGRRPSPAGSGWSVCGLSGGSSG